MAIKGDFPNRMYLSDAAIALIRDALSQYDNSDPELLRETERLFRDRGHSRPGECLEVKAGEIAVPTLETFEPRPLTVTKSIRRAGRTITAECIIATADGKTAHLSWGFMQDTGDNLVNDEWLWPDEKVEL